MYTLKPSPYSCQVKAGSGWLRTAVPLLVRLIGQPNRTAHHMTSVLPSHSCTESALPICGVINCISLFDDPLEGLLKVLPGLLRLRLQVSRTTRCTGTSDNRLWYCMLNAWRLRTVESSRVFARSMAWTTASICPDCITLGARAQGACAWLQ